MDKKYELVKNNSTNYRGRTLYRIRALKDFNDVKKGDLGGYVESEKNLSQDDNCWIYDNAKVFDNAGVYDNVRVSDNATVSGGIRMGGNAGIRPIHHYSVLKNTGSSGRSFTHTKNSKV